MFGVASSMTVRHQQEVISFRHSHPHISTLTRSSVVSTRLHNKPFIMTYSFHFIPQADPLCPSVRVMLLREIKSS